MLSITFQHPFLVYHTLKWGPMHIEVCWWVINRGKTVKNISCPITFSMRFQIKKGMQCKHTKKQNFRLPCKDWKPKTMPSRFFWENKQKIPWKLSHKIKHFTEKENRNYFQLFLVNIHHFEWFAVIVKCHFSFVSRFIYANWRTKKMKNGCSVPCSYVITFGMP